MAISTNIGSLVTAAIRPASPNDPIATAYSTEIKGGHHAYKALVDRDNLIEQRRDWGMFVTVYDDGINNGIYQLQYNLVDTNLMNNSNWVLYNPGGIEVKYNIRPSDYIVVPVDVEYFVYGDLTIEGYLINYGKVVVANGEFTISGGTFSNSGTLELVTIATQSGGGGTGSGLSIQYLIDTNDVIDVPTNNEYLIYGDLTIRGILNNDGKVVIIDGNLVMDGGTFSNDGTLELVTIFTQSGTQSGNGVATQYIVAPTDVIYVPVNTEYLIYGDLILQGTMNNDGKVVIIDGSLVFDGGTFSNNSGLLQFVTVNGEDSLIATTINIGEIYSVPTGFEYLVWGDLTVKGDLINSGGDVIILNGDLVMAGGTYSNPGGGNLKLISVVQGQGSVNQIPYFVDTNNIITDNEFYRIPGASTMISTTVSSLFEEQYSMGVGTFSLGTSSFLVGTTIDSIGGFLFGQSQFSLGDMSTFSTQMLYLNNTLGLQRAIVMNDNRLIIGASTNTFGSTASTMQISIFHEGVANFGTYYGLNRLNEYSINTMIIDLINGSTYSLGISTQSGIYWEYNDTRFILPKEDGLTGDHLVTDGSGNLSFTSSYFSQGTFSGTFSIDSSMYYVDIDCTVDVSVPILPQASSVPRGTTFILTDYLSNSAMNAIVITCTASDVINGAPSQVLSSNGIGAIVHSDPSGFWVMSRLS